MNELPLYEYQVDEFDDETGMFIISMVDRPAMLVQAVKLSEQVEQPQLVTVKCTNQMKQHLTSAVIIPNKPIFRDDERRGKYNATFSVDGVEKIRNKFLKQTGNLKLSNKNHKPTDTLQVQMLETWIIADAAIDKAVALGFEGLPVGTLMMTYHIQDNDFWNNEVLTGNVTGFSLEGVFKEMEVKLQEEEAPTPAAVEVDEIETFLKHIENIMEEGV